MARPIFVVHDQETIENYRRLERILRELYQVLGELLAYGAPVVPAAPVVGHRQPPPPPPPPQPETPSILQNVVNLLATLLGQSFAPSSTQNSSSRHGNGSRNGRNRRQRRTSTESIEIKQVSHSTAFGNWSAIGSELREVADSLGGNGVQSTGMFQQNAAAVPERTTVLEKLCPMSKQESRKNGKT